MKSLLSLPISSLKRENCNLFLLLLAMSVVTLFYLMKSLKSVSCGTNALTDLAYCQGYTKNLTTSVSAEVVSVLKDECIDSKYIYYVGFLFI